MPIADAAAEGARPRRASPALKRAAPPKLALRWVSDADAGIRREGEPGHFRYRGPNGRLLRDEATLQRIRSLAIPPAYQDVWICAAPEGHLQATGRDARGRKQYRYHPQWQARRGQTKFDALRRFGEALPRLREKVRRQLAADDTLSRERVLATLVRLLDTTWVRIGNDAYARDNGSYGLTTLQNRHVQVKGSALRLSFLGKSGVRHALTLDDPKVARIVRRCRELPGQELFQYQDDDGEPHRLGSAEVNRWLQDAAGDDITAKNFRTWHGSVLALQLLLARCTTCQREADQACQARGKDGNARPAAAMPRGTKGEILAEVAARLGNTPAVCRKSYLHPAVLDLCDTADPCALLASPWVLRPAAKRGLSLPERQLMAMLAPVRPPRRARAA